MSAPKIDAIHVTKYMSAMPPVAQMTVSANFGVTLTIRVAYSRNMIRNTPRVAPMACTTMPS